MKKRLIFLFFIVLLVSSMAWGEDKPLYLDAKASPEQRTEDLLARMTLKEKLGQITQIEVLRLMQGFWNKGPLDTNWLQKVIVDYGVGSVLSGGDGAPRVNNPEEWAKMTNEIQKWALKTRLKIPVLYGVDAVHGHSLVRGATVYPYNLGLAATFNPELAKAYAAQTAEEIAATGCQWTFAPVLDVAVDPRWGRTTETFGEDPFLVSVMGVNVIRGFEQSHKIISCAKHFTGYSAPKDGCDRHPAEISERDLREIHFAPYFAAAKAGLSSVMVNSGAVNGVPAHASKWLLSDILRGEIGFKGLIVSDWEDVGRLVSYHKFAQSMEEALTLSYNAGLDMNMVPDDVTVIDKLEKLVTDGKISTARIDEATRQVLMVKFRLGLFENRTVDTNYAKEIIGSNESKKIAREIADQSITLLRNENNLLPLAKTVKSLLVIGPSANKLGRLCGGFTINWLGASENDLNGKTVLAAIKEKVGSDAKVTYMEDAANKNGILKAAKAAEATIVVVGEDSYAEGRGNSPTLRLQRREEQIIETLQEAELPFVLVVAAGRPIILPGEDKAAPSILWAYLPGTEGGNAIADVIFGDYNPSGRLPISFPRSVEQLPVAYYHSRANNEPIYSFGFGLSYTQFICTDFQAPESVKVGRSATITVKIKNIGKLAGDRSILVFAKRDRTDLPLFTKSLVGFAKVSLTPGEEKSVVIEVQPEQLSYWNEHLKFVETPCEFTLETEGKVRTISVIQ